MHNSKKDKMKLKAAKDFYKQGIQMAKENGDKHAAKEMEEFLDELE